METQPDALDSLHTLLLTAPKIEDFLSELAELAAKVVDPPASCGVTTHYDGKPRTVATSDERAALIDEQQYGDDEGPCLQSMRTGQLVEVGDQTTDYRWPEYRKGALHLGLKCSLSFPLVADGESIGAMNLYGYDRPHAFSAIDRQRGATFAAQASTALTLAIRFAKQSELADQLQQALKSRSIIDQAMGVLMGQQHCDAETAFALLRTHSQNNNRKLRDVAADIITRLTGHPPISRRSLDTTNPSLSEQGEQPDT